MQYIRVPQKATWLADQSLPALEAQGRRMADHLIKGLTTAPALDPSSPCIIVLVSLLEDFKLLVGQIAKRRSVSESAILRSTFGAALDAFIAFANSTWTAKEKATFESCHCAHHTGELATTMSNNYRRIRGEELVLLKEMVIRIFLLLAQAFRSVATAIRSGSKLGELPGKPGKWPSSPSQLIPYGAATTQSAFLRWAQITEGPGPIRTLCLLSFCVPNLASEMNKNEALIRPIIGLFCEYVYWLEEVVAAKLTADPRLGLVEGTISEYYYVFTNKWFESRVYNQQFVKSNTPTLLSFYKGLCVLIPLLDRLYFSATAKEHITAEISMTAYNVYNSLGSTSSPVALHHSYVDFLENFSNAVDSPIGTLMTGIRNLRHQSLCTEPACDLTPEVVGMKFKTCSACQTTAYCSKACQALDWKAHRRVCKVLKVLFPISLEHYNAYASAVLTLPTQEMMNMFTKEVERAGFGEEDMARATEYVVQHSNCVEEIQKFLSRYNIRVRMDGVKADK